MCVCFYPLVSIPLLVVELVGSLGSKWISYIKSVIWGKNEKYGSLICTYVEVMVAHMYVYLNAFDCCIKLLEEIG